MAFKAARRGAIPPFIVMEVMRAANERAAAGEDVLHLEVGQPSGGAPPQVLAAAHAALDSDPLGYTEALGLPALRQRIARHYQDGYGVDVAAESVCITTGSSAAFLLAFLAAFEAGDRVAVAAPGYPAYRNILSALGIQVLLLPVGPATRYQITAEILDRLDQPPDGVVVASPSNPTGTMLSAAEMTALAQWCENRGVRLISDEIYHGISYGDPAASALGRCRHGIIVNSFSKYYAMTGWRLGWMVVPPDLLRPVECLQQNLFISPPTLAQRAALAAFDADDALRARVAAYGVNRAILLNELPAAGFDQLAPSDGAFYIYADVSGRTDDSAAFCRRMLAETGVAATPGLDFDPLSGHRFLRFSYAGAETDIREAARRLKGWKTG